MKRHIAGLAALVLGLSVGATVTARTEVTDKEITEKIVGKWSLERDDEGVKCKGTVEYKKDGTLAAEGTFETADQMIKFKVTGKWKAENGFMVETYEMIDPEGLMPAGTISKDKVLSLDDKTYSYENEQGKKRKLTRIKD